MDTFIFGANSMTMLLQNSPELQRWLRSNLQKCTTVVKLDALASGIRKHRLDSTQMPLARAVLRHEAMIMTAVQISSARRGEHAALCADYFLMYCSGSEGIRRLILLGMLADAGDESAMIVRAFDKRLSDPADTAFWIASYVRRVQLLFLDKGCLETGYTKVILAALAKPVVYTVKGTALQCGRRSGPTDDDINYCLNIMQCWARLALATAKAEFPEFTVMYAMSVFKLSSRDFADRHSDHSIIAAGSADIDEKLATLASAFSLDAVELSNQYHDTREIAQAMRLAGPVGDKDAWRNAVLRLAESCEFLRHRSPLLN